MSHQPGDLVNGRILGSDGVWHPTHGAFEPAVPLDQHPDGPRPTLGGPGLAADAPRRNHRRWIVAVVAGVAVLAGLAVADGLAARSEMGRMLDTIDVSEAATLKGYETTLTAVNAKPTSTYVSAQDTETWRTGMESACSAAAISIQDSRARLDEVSILPWHHSLKAAQDRYGAHATVWLGVFRDCASKPETLADRGVWADIDATALVARRALLNAAPRFSDYHDRLTATIKVVGPARG
jgi:hypothetical protein